MSDESIKTPSTSTNPLLNYVGTKIRVEFKGSWNNYKISFNHGKVVNIYIAYEINKNFNLSSYQTLENCLFGVVALTEHPDIDQYEYSGYWFDRKWFFLLGNEIARNVIIFR